MGDTATAALDSTQAVADALVKNVLENRRAGNDRLMLAAAWADMHQVPPGVKDGEHPGAEGTPEVARFAVEELSVLIEKHVHAGRQVVADALNLRHRHPRLWARVQAYEVEAWVAAQTARRVAAAGLSAVQARWVDEETAGALAELPVGRYFTVLDAKVIEADQALAEARRGEAMQRRFVRKTRLNEHGLKGLYAMATFTGVDTVYATVDRAASILMLQGDQDPAEVRRSKAFELLGNPTRLLELFGWAEDNADLVDPMIGDPTDPDPDPLTSAELELLPPPALSKAPRIPVVIHVSVSLEAIQARSGVARIEDAGPVALAALKELLGHCQITLKPVVDLTRNKAVDKYEIPTWLKELSRERFPYEVFPYGTISSRKADQDHSKPYQLLSEGGPPGQTNLDNLGPLGRRSHRIKTFGKGWRHIRLGPRSFLWRTPTGYWFRVDPDGTTPLGPEPSEIEEQFKAWLYTTC